MEPTSEIIRPGCSSRWWIVDWRVVNSVAAEVAYFMKLLLQNRQRRQLAELSLHSQIVFAEANIGHISQADRRFPTAKRRMNYEVFYAVIDVLNRPMC